MQDTASSRSFAKAAKTPKKLYKSIGVWVLAFLGLFVLGTFIVLSTVVHYFGTHQSDFITVQEVKELARLESSVSLPFDASISPAQAAAEYNSGIRREKVPKIIHQTWKDDVLPERWQTVREKCQAMLPDFEFKLWTDAGSREFIETHYSSFLSTWDSYRKSKQGVFATKANCLHTAYNIQRADAIRYFVLHKYGGIYMDLDIGCRAHPGPLLHYQTILPVTKPVGVSNDLIFSAPQTPFMDLVIHSLDTFNHRWLWMNYPTVMFSTGPMYISAMYSLWCRLLAKGFGQDEHITHARVKILPKSLYGKNAPPEAVPHSFFWH
jgi:mannosyltransferase OCH1-like enzyme